MTTPTLRVLLALAWPVVLSRATQSVVGFTDALMVAPLGEKALAAATTGSLDSVAFFLLPMGTVFLIQSFAAQLRGRGELESIRRYAYYGLVLAAAAAAIALAAMPFVPGVFAGVGDDPEVGRLVGEYLEIRLLSVGAVVGAEALGNWYGGLGNTRMAMVASLVTMVANIALNYLLIEPRFGLPGYGVAGAAAASATASWVGFGVIALAFHRGVGHDAPRGDARLRKKELLRVLRFGLPNGANWFLEFAAFALFVNVVVGELGTTALAAMNVVIQVSSVAFMPAFGLASAGAILVGEAIGRGARDDVPRIVRMTVATAAGFMLLVGTSYLVVPHEIVSLFATGEGGGELVAVGGSMLALAFFWQVFDAVGIALGEALRAAGDTAYCLVARLLIAWVVFVPLAFVSVWHLDGGTTAAMLSIAVYLVALSGVLTFRFMSGRWREIELVGEPVPHLASGAG